MAGAATKFGPTDEGQKRSEDTRLDCPSPQSSHRLDLGSCSSSPLSFSARKGYSEDARCPPKHNRETVGVVPKTVWVKSTMRTHTPVADGNIFDVFEIPPDLEEVKTTGEVDTPPGDE